MHQVLKKYWHVPGLLIVLVILFLSGSWYGKRQVATQKAAGSRPILYYVDPMNPAHTSPKPGLAPSGMKLEPVYADDGGRVAGSTMPPGSFKITPEKQQIMGLRIAAVEQAPWTYRLKTTGKVAVDENRIYRLNAFTDGWVVRIFNHTTGSLVRKDEPLATFYNQDLPTTLQTYFYALDAMDQDQKLFPGQQDLLLAQQLSAAGVLMNLGMGKLQLDDLARSRELTQEIIINTPATSFILARNITPGQRFAAGEELYRLADLSRVWVLADLFESEAKYIRPGEKVQGDASQPGREAHGDGERNSARVRSGDADREGAPGGGQPPICPQARDVCGRGVSHQPACLDQRAGGRHPGFRAHSRPYSSTGATVISNRAGSRPGGAWETGWKSSRGSSPASALWFPAISSSIPRPGCSWRWREWAAWIPRIPSAALRWMRARQRLPASKALIKTRPMISARIRAGKSLTRGRSALRPNQKRARLTSRR